MSVPLHTCAPLDHEQPLASSHAVLFVYVAHGLGVPEHVPPTPPSPAVHVQPCSYWHCVW